MTAARTASERFVIPPSAARFSNATRSSSSSRTVTTVPGPARLGATQESDGAAAEGRNQPQLRQPRPGSARRSRDVRGEGAHPRQYRVRNSVTGPSPCRNIRRPDTALNETKNPPSGEPPLLLEDLRKPLDIPRKAPYRPQTNDMVERSSLRVDLRPHLHNQPQREATYQTRLHHHNHR